MAKRRKKRTLRPRVPSRVKRRKRPAKERSHHHPELIGLGLVAAGLFLSTLVYLEWEGGTAGGLDRRRPVGAGRRRRLPAPGGPRDRRPLMLGRSRLVEVRPFRWGLASTALGVFLVLADSGGYVGTVLDEVVGTLDRPHRHPDRRHRLRDRRDPAPVGRIGRRARPALPRRRPPRPHRRQAPRRAALDARRPAARTRRSRSGPETTVRRWTRSRTSPTSSDSRSRRRSSTRWTSRPRPASSRTCSIRPHRRRRTTSCPSRRC